MNNFDIGITTFSLRFDFVSNLIRSIRGLGIENNIFLCVNGEKDSDLDEEYRIKILNLCSSYKNIYPIFFSEIRGLAKMWNTLIIHSSKENILMLNDDILIKSTNIFDVVSNHVKEESYFGLSIINNTFSFFVVNKHFIDELGYFDERLLGFGEEDGDIMFRLLKIGKTLNRINVQDVENIVSDIRHEHIKPGIGKYSFFNRNFIFTEKYHCNGNIYYFPEGIKCEEKLPNLNLYPYEKYFMDNKNKL